MLNLLYKGKDHLMADPLFYSFGFSCFVMFKLSTILLVWLNPSQSNWRLAVQWLFPLQSRWVLSGLRSNRVIRRSHTKMTWTRDLVIVKQFVNHFATIQSWSLKRRTWDVTFKTFKLTTAHQLKRTKVSVNSNRSKLEINFHKRLNFFSKFCSG